jgi:hypothetical protein
VDMADGYARVTNGKPPGVFAMQYGPGSGNAFPGIATTFSDSVPVMFRPFACFAPSNFVLPTVGAIPCAGNLPLSGAVSAERVAQLSAYELRL